MTRACRCLDRGDVMPREAYDRVRAANWTLTSQRWAALRLACYLLVIVNCWGLADAETLAAADAAMEVAA